jgi:hypothetical protein
MDLSVCLPFRPKYRRLSWAQYVPAVPATLKTEVERSLEPRSLKQAWASETLSQKNKQTPQNIYSNPEAFSCLLLSCIP